MCPFCDSESEFILDFEDEGEIQTVCLLCGSVYWWMNVDRETINFLRLSRQTPAVLASSPKSQENLAERSRQDA